MPAPIIIAGGAKALGAKAAAGSTLKGKIVPFIKDKIISTIKEKAGQKVEEGISNVRDRVKDRLSNSQDTRENEAMGGTIDNAFDLDQDLFGNVSDIKGLWVLIKIF